MSDMAKRQKIITFEAALKRYDVEYGCSLPQFLRLIEAIVESIPAEERDNVKVDWTDGDSCDSGFIEFQHWRDETDEEVATRVSRAQALASAQARQREREERAALAKLKAKYEQQ